MRNRNIQWYIPDHIVLVSYNEHHKPMEIHINRIRALAFIKASLRLNSLTIFSGNSPQRRARTTI